MRELLFFILVFGITQISAQYFSKPFERKVFIDNKGQFQNELPEEYRNFNYCIDNGTQIFFYNNKVVFHFIDRKLEEWKEEEIKESKRGGFKSEEEEKREREKFKPEHQFIELSWENSNKDSYIEIADPVSSEYNYIRDINNSGKPQSIHCSGYEKLYIRNVYKGVDLEYMFTNESNEIKYNVLLSEDADIESIKFKYDERFDVSLKGGNIEVNTILGQLKEFKPRTFNKKNLKEITSYFLKNESLFSYYVEDVDSTDNQLIIDPIIAVPGLGGAVPVDNGIDAFGNHYVASTGFILEKYDPAGNMLFSTNVLNATYYGDMLTSSTGNCYFNTVGFHPRGDATAVDSDGNFLWDSFGITECWRFVLNECYGQVYSLTGYRHSATGFATIDVNTGALSNYTQSGSCCYDPHCGVVDDNGDVYSVASNPPTIHRWSPTNTSLGTYPSPIPFGYFSGYAGGQGYNGMAKLGDFLFLHNGATIAKVNKLTGALVGQKAVPNGTKSRCGGIYVTSCGYLLIGSTDGVYLLDNNFNQLDFRATNGAVYDLVFNEFNQNFAVCGPGHVSEVNFNIPPCIFETNPEIVPSCNNTATGSIKLNLAGGVPSYTYVWSGNGLVANTDSVGGLLPGTYKCVYSDNRCPVPTVDSVEVTVGVQIVVASFLANDVCLGEITEFENNSTTSVGSITNVEWDFADGNTSLLSSPQNLYAADGGYQVKLVITATHSCKDSVDTQLVTVNPLPIADFTNPIECHNEGVQFTSTSTVTSGNIANWEWHFGDNTYGNVGNPLHNYPVDTYPFLSTYDVYLKVTTNNGCIDDTVMQYTPHPLPRTVFAGENSCVNIPIQFTNLSQVVSPGAITSSIYNFGDGSAFVSIDNPIHTFTSSGDYNVSLITTSNNGCVNDTTITVSVYPEPIASFMASTECENETPTLFQNLSTISNGSIVGYTWNFGNETSSLANPSHSFEESGNYTVVLTAVSNYNCQNTFSSQVTVNAAPLSKFIVDAPEGCDEHCVQFTDLSIANSSNIISHLWQFENGDTLFDASPEVCFANKSNTDDISFDVKLITQNDLGCKDTLFLEDYITVYHNPVAIFNPTELVENMYESEFFMENNSIGSNGYVWDFGDGEKGFDYEPVHIYSDTGTYYITLVAYTLNNCMDTTIQGVRVTPVISVYVPNTFTPNGDGENDIFNLKSYGIVEDGFEMYIFDRWGTQLYYTNELNKGWDGTYKNVISQQDAYVYKIFCKDVFGEMHEYKGHVNILK